MRFAVACLLSIAAGAILFVPGTANSHPERTTVFANPASGAVPKYRSTGPYVVVCKSTSRALLKQQFKKNRPLLKKRLKMLSRCKYHDIQEAINHAKSGYRVLIMPGTYLE